MGVALACFANSAYGDTVAVGFDGLKRRSDPRAPCGMGRLAGVLPTVVNLGLLVCGAEDRLARPDLTGLSVMN